MPLSVLQHAYIHSHNILIVTYFNMALQITAWATTVPHFSATCLQLRVTYTSTLLTVKFTISEVFML